VSVILSRHSNCTAALPMAARDQEAGDQRPIIPNSAFTSVGRETLSCQRQTFPCAHVPPAHCTDSAVRKESPVWLDCAWRRGMPGQDAKFDYSRYRQLLAEAVDDSKRLAFIELLIQERAKELLQAQRASDRMAMTVATITTVLASAPG